MRLVLLLNHFQMSNLRLRMVKALRKDTQLVSGRAGMQIQIAWLQDLSSKPPHSVVWKVHLGLARALEIPARHHAAIPRWRWVSLAPPYSREVRGAERQMKSRGRRPGKEGTYTQQNLSSPASFHWTDTVLTQHLFPVYFTICFWKLKYLFSFSNNCLFSNN